MIAEIFVSTSSAKLAVLLVIAAVGFANAKTETFIAVANGQEKIDQKQKLVSNFSDDGVNNVQTTDHAFQVWFRVNVFEITSARIRNQKTQLKERANDKPLAVVDLLNGEDGPFMISTENVSFAQIAHDSDQAEQIKKFETHDAVKLLASPTITTISGRKGSVFLGDDLDGIKLQLTPKIRHTRMTVEMSFAYSETKVNPVDADLPMSFVRRVNTGFSAKEEHSFVLTFRYEMVNGQELLVVVESNAIPFSDVATPVGKN